MMAPAIAPGGPAETPTMAPTRAPDAPPSASCAMRRLAVVEDGVPTFLLLFIALLLARAVCAIGSTCVTTKMQRACSGASTPLFPGGGAGRGGGPAAPRA